MIVSPVVRGAQIGDEVVICNFLSQSPNHQPVLEKEEAKIKTAASSIQEAEIVFSSNRFYGHVTAEKDAQFVEIRGYKWGE